MKGMEANQVEWRAVFEDHELHTIVGNVLVIEDFNMPELNTTRRLWVYLPPSYTTDLMRRYPVLYMHDGQNVFDQVTSTGSEWGVDEALEKLSKENAKHETIVVAIDHGDEERCNEYTIKANKKHGFTGKGDAYVSFLIHTLKPFIDKEFRTKKVREHTAIAGSSFGAYISIYAFLKHPEIFSRVGAFSLMVWQDKGWLKKEIRKSQKRFSARIYISIGDQEASKWHHAFMLKREAIGVANAFRRAGFSEEEVMFDKVAGGKHHESTWRESFPAAFKWWSSDLK